MLPDRVKAAYVRALKSGMGPGETLTIRRASGTGAGDYSVAGWVTKIVPDDLVGAVEQVKRNGIVLADDLAAAGFPLPLLPKQDRLVWNGSVLAITAVDDDTVRVQGILIAYKFDLSGA